jgi:hypothetical protein
MPLFGAVTLSVSDPSPLTLRSAAVLPSREKKVILTPYPDLVYEFRKSSDTAEVAIFLGTSLRDPDIQGVLNKCAARMPTFVISRSGRYESGVVPETATTLRQSASRFLISTLPAFLRQSNPDDLQRYAESDDSYSDPILEWLILASKTDARTRERCLSIERLASAEIALEGPEVEVLFQDTDAEVRINALGLVQNSPDHKYLIERAQLAVTSRPDSALAKELQILTQLMDKPKGR